MKTRTQHKITRPGNDVRAVTEAVGDLKADGVLQVEYNGVHHLTRIATAMQVHYPHTAFWLETFTSNNQRYCYISIIKHKP